MKYINCRFFFPNTLSPPLKSPVTGMFEVTAELAAEKGASSWLTVIPVKDMQFIFNKREFQVAIHLGCNWQISDLKSVCACVGNRYMSTMQ